MKTDAQLRTDVSDELEWDPTVTSTDISVAVKDGIVTLSGTAPHYVQKWAAERATQRVDGVKAIVESIEVRLSDGPRRTDSDIAQAAVTSLNWHVWVPNHVTATVEAGWVTLTGSVEWGFERASAYDAVRFLAGVKGVSNNITIRPSIRPAAVKDEIERALKRNAEIDAANINVTSNGGKVTLSGTVRSMDERDEAGAAAWNAPGVTSLENELLVVV